MMMWRLFAFAAAWMAGLMAVVSWRLLRGPTLADRVVALDAVNTLVVASMLLGAVLLHGTWMVDVAIIYALLSYVGTLYIARVMRKD